MVVEAVLLMVSFLLETEVERRIWVYFHSPLHPWASLAAGAVEVVPDSQHLKLLGAAWEDLELVHSQICRHQRAEVVL